MGGPGKRPLTGTFARNLHPARRYALKLGAREAITRGTLS